MVPFELRWILFELGIGIADGAEVEAGLCIGVDIGVDIGMDVGFGAPSCLSGWRLAVSFSDSGGGSRACSDAERE